MTDYATDAAKEIATVILDDAGAGIRGLSKEAIDMIAAILSRHRPARERELEKALDMIRVVAQSLVLQDWAVVGDRMKSARIQELVVEALDGRREPARDSELEREFRQHEALAAECERAGTDYSKGRAYGIREVIHYARLAIAGRKEQSMDNADKKRIIEATADWENGMRQREAATDSPLPQTTELDRRVYYQDLVYAACNTLDRLLKLRICCGTVDSPTSEFRDALKLLTDRFMELAAEHAATMPIYSPPTDAGECDMPVTGGEMLEACLPSSPTKEADLAAREIRSHIREFGANAGMSAHSLGVITDIIRRHRDERVRELENALEAAKSYFNLIHHRCVGTMNGKPVQATTEDAMNCITAALAGRKEQE